MPESKSKKLAVVVLAALVAVLVIAGIALMMRGGDNAPVRIILPTLERSLAGEAVAGTELSPKTKAEPEIQVYVSAAVRWPGGDYTLIPGDRLIDAVEAAGGGIPEADLEAVNLALRVQDEAQYKIPRIGEPPDPESNVVTAPSASQNPPGDRGQSSGGLIDLNKASVELLETLPGIGPVRAGDIVADRELNGPFLTVEQITRVQGIGAAIFEDVRELVTVDESP